MDRLPFEIGTKSDKLGSIGNGAPVPFPKDPAGAVSLD